MAAIEPTVCTAVEFTVPGTPAPQGSHRAIMNRHTGRAVVIDDNPPKLKDWRAQVASAANDAADDADLRTPFDCAVSVHVRFFLPKPKAAPTAKVWCDKRPDVDKLARAVLDALTGTVLRDDSLVCSLRAEKVYGPRTGAVVRVAVL